MAFSGAELKRIENLVGNFVDTQRPPEQVRGRFDISFRVQSNSVEIFEIRAASDLQAAKTEHPIAKATYVAANDCWKIYYQRSDLKWHRYQPSPTTAMLEDFFVLVAEDEHACFFG